jgi:hypothetical protein
MENEKIKVVCVSNNAETFEKVIGQNPYMNKFEIFKFDNSSDNIGISKRYNSFIKENITPNSDFWVIFAHQDFGFEEDILPKLKTLNKKFIYGPIGTYSRYTIVKYVKSALYRSLGFYPKFRFKQFKFIKRPIEEFNIQRANCYGSVKQGDKDNFEIVGNRIKTIKTVTTLDCCCMIVHSSLINRYNLRFDENLNWHMYVEEFCLNAKKLYKIKSKAIQFECIHLGAGNFNEDFYNSVEYVTQKHNVKDIRTTCVNT